MAESDSRLIAGEEIVFRTSKHWLAPIADSWKAVLLIIASLVLAWLQTEQTDGLIGFGNRVLGLLETVLMLGGILLIVYNLISWRSAKYMVTNMRVLGQEGLAHKRETDSLLASIADVRTRSSFIGRLFHYGSINIISASGEAGADTFSTVRDHETFKKRILEQKMAAPVTAAVPDMAMYAQMQATAGNGHSADAPTPHGAEVLTTLAVLASLRDAQTITPEEYEAKKVEMLARI
jgi:uncharacterized membrane protein YdbT with pleckstrin-like domain